MNTPQSQSRTQSTVAPSASGSTQHEKTLELINVYSCDNIGDAAIYASFIDMAQSQQVVWPVNQLDVNDNNQKVGHIAGQWREHSPVDGRISVGGDIFNNARPKLVTKRFLQNVFQLQKTPATTALFGQSIPRSCHGMSFKLLSYALRKMASVTVRDVESYQRLQAAGVAVKLSYDAVFSQTVQPQWLERVTTALIDHIDFQETALISLRPFDGMYQYDTRSCIKQLVALSEELSQQGYVPTVLYHAQVDGQDDDALMVQAIQQQTHIKVIDPFQLAEKIAETVADERNTLTPWQCGMAAVALAELVIGVRYHTSIFRLAAGKMPFNLYYSNKGQDLTTRLSVPGMSIQDFVAAEHIEQVLETATMSFDHAVIARQVRQDFAHCLQQIVPTEKSSEQLSEAWCDV